MVLKYLRVLLEIKNLVKGGRFCGLTKKPPLLFLISSLYCVCVRVFASVRKEKKMHIFNEINKM